MGFGAHTLLTMKPKPASARLTAWDICGKGVTGWVLHPGYLGHGLKLLGLGLLVGPHTGFCVILRTGASAPQP